MKARLESTTRIVDVDGVPARVWQGETEQGVPFVALITRVAVHRLSDQAQFERELIECADPNEAAIAAFPTRMRLVL